MLSGETGLDINPLHPCMAVTKDGLSREALQYWALCLPRQASRLYDKAAAVIADMSR